MIETQKETSHKEILKATGILGGAQIIEIFIRILRNKVAAVLLGPTGVGLIGLYQATIDMIHSATGLGLEMSAVRDIAESSGTNNIYKISKTVMIFKRWIWFTGLLGMISTILFSKYLSIYAFGDERFAFGIVILSVVLLFNSLTGGQLAILQGMRKISMMAKAKVWGLLIAFCFTVPLYWVYGIKAIVPVFIVSNCFSFIFTWSYTRKISFKYVKIKFKEIFYGGIGMVRLGFFMVITGLINTATMYIIRAFIANKTGMDDVGQFQAAWNLSLLYLGAVLQAMGADYFPRLSAVNHENEKVVKLVNEQTEVALMISGPIVVGMLALINFVILILYSEKFSESVNILHWMLAGTFLKVLSWPLAFIMLAKGRGGIFVFTEILSNIIHLCPIVFLWEVFGLEITGIAFIFMYFCYTIIVMIVAARLCNFIWTRQNFRHIIIFILLIFMAFCSSKMLSGIKSYSVGISIFIVTMCYSFVEFNKLFNLKKIFRKIIGR